MSIKHMNYIFLASMLAVSSFATTVHAAAVMECPKYPGYNGGDVVHHKDGGMTICIGNEDIDWAAAPGPSVQDILNGMKNVGNAILNLRGTMPNEPQG